MKKETPMVDPILVQVPVSALRCNDAWNVRRGSASEKADELESLRTSIAAQGVQQPLDVTRSTDGQTFNVVAGFRRAAISCALAAEEIAAGKPERQVPVIVRTLTEREARALNLTENLGKKSLRPNELARGLDEYARAAGPETQEQIGKRFGLSQGYVSQLLMIRKLGSPELLAWWDQFPDTCQPLLYEVAGMEKPKQLAALRAMLTRAGPKKIEATKPLKIAQEKVRAVLRTCAELGATKPAAWREGASWALASIGLARAKAPKKAAPKKAAPKKAPKKAPK
jgi:ParB/RepB/Spo0J family partition protein